MRQKRHWWTQNFNQWESPGRPIKFRQEKWVAAACPSARPMSRLHHRSSTSPPMATTPSAPLQCPDSVPREHMTSREEYRTAGLAEARRIVREDIGHVILPPLDSLWECYPSKHKLDGIKSHLTHLGWLCDGKWNPARLSKQSVQKAGNLTEYEAFKCLAEIFNDVLQLDASTREHVGVKSMIHAGYTEPKSDKISVHRPDAFLFMHSGLNNSPPPGNGGHPPTTPVAIIPTSVYWKDLTCPFEYKFEKGNEDDVRPSVSSPGCV